MKTHTVHTFILGWHLFCTFWKFDATKNADNFSKSGQRLEV